MSQRQGAPAVPAVPNAGGGSWEGNTFKLREFLVSPASGRVDNVAYWQTMGRLSLRYVLTEAAEGLSAKDLTVELSSWELKVQIDGQIVGSISGDLWGAVRRDLSWWTLETESGALVFVLELAKKDHCAWSGLWYAGGLSQRRKQHFGWTDKQPTPLKKAEDMLVKVKAGKRGSSGKDPFLINRESLCTGLEEGQDHTTATIRVELDGQALEKACDSVCLAQLFGVDVAERCIKIFIRGDERSPIRMGELGGSCIPEKTTWEIVNLSSKPASRQADGQLHHRALQINLLKGLSSRSEWSKLVNENAYALQRECAPASFEELQRLVSPARPRSPDRSAWRPDDHAQESKTKGDAAFKALDFRDAAVHYTRALGHTPKDEKLYSNRAACYSRLRKFEKSLSDAQTCLSLKQSWPKGYFRQGQALRGLQRWEDARGAFAEGRFRDPDNPDWDKEIARTDEDEAKAKATNLEERKHRREADLTTELNEALIVAERNAMSKAAEEAIKAGRNPQEASQLALKAAEAGKKEAHEAESWRRAAMVEDGNETEEPARYRIVCADGSVHPKGFAHTDKGMYFMGMTAMNYNQEPCNQPWVEIYHPRKLRWSQGCGQLKLRVELPASVRAAAEVEVRITATSLRIATRGVADALADGGGVLVLVEGELERKVEPEGENYAWYISFDEVPAMLELSMDKDSAEVWQTFSYGTLLWPRLFNDDAPLGAGLFEADLTDLPEQLLEKYRREQARSNEKSEKERARRDRLTEEEIMEEAARNHNTEFAKHGIPHRMETQEDKLAAECLR